MRRCDQALYHHTVFQVRVDDLVNVVHIDKAVPHALGVDHTHWPAGAAVKAASLVDPHLAWAIEPGGFDRAFAVLSGQLRVVVAT